MAFERYRVVTGDESLEADCGLEVLVETARLWMSLGPPRPPRRLAHRRRHRPRRVHRDRARQRLHQPDGRAQSASSPPTPVTAIPRPPTRWASPPRRRPPGATRPSPSTFRTTRSWACTSSAKASPPSRSGTSKPTRPIRCCCTSLRAALPRAGDQAGRPGAGDAVAEPRVHARAEGPQRRLLRARGRCATRRCRPAPRR